MNRVRLEKRDGLYVNRSDLVWLNFDPQVVINQPSLALRRPM